MKKFSLFKFLLLILFFGFRVDAQDINLLLSKVEKAQSEQEKSNAYIRLMDYAIYIHHSDAKKYLDKLENESNVSGSQILNAVYLLESANYDKEFVGDYESSFQKLKKSEEVFKSRNLIDELAICYNYITLLAYWNKIGDSTYKHSQYIYKEYIKPLQVMVPRIKDKNITVTILNNIGSFFAAMEENIDSALYYTHSAEEYLDTTILSYVRTGILGSLSITYGGKLDYDNALKYAELCEKVPDFANDLYGKGNVYRSLSKLLVQPGPKQNLPKALFYAKEAMLLANKSENMTYISLANLRMYYVFKAMNKNDSALFYFEKHDKAEDNINREKFRLTMSQSEVIRKNLELQELNIAKLKVENDKFRLIRTMLLIGLILLMFGLSWYSYNHKMIKEKNKQLEQKNLEIRSAFLEGKTQEQKRLASELHDNLNTKIAAMSWQLEAINSSNLGERDKAILEKISQISNDLYNDVRLIAHNTIPVELSSHGLEMAVNKLLIVLNSHDKPKFHFISNIKVEIDSNVNNEIYKIILELCNNILKHSQASEAWISIIAENNLLTLTIADNGIGQTNISSVSEGIGLKSVQSRVEALGGMQIINSNINPGYKTEIKIPL